MRNCKSRLLAAGLGLALLSGPTNARAGKEDTDKDKEKKPPAKQGIPGRQRGERTARPGGYGAQPAGPGAQPGGPGGQRSPVGPTDRPIVKPPLEPKRSDVKLVEKKQPDGAIVKESPSGKVREKTMTKPGGVQQTQHFNPAGSLDTKVVRQADGTKQTTKYDLGREKTTEVVHPSGARETTEVHYNRAGEVRVRETIKTDANGAPVSKTVVVKNNLAIHNTTVVNNNVTIVNNTTVVREYRPCRYGYVYAPVVIAPAVYVGWYDPFWYSAPGVVVTTHSFGFSWGWGVHPWYARHRAYWEPYPVYVGPSYWVTDWMVAGYLADRYAVEVSVEQTREEVRLAREEAEKARLAAEQARDAAEIAEAKAAQAQAEARAERAEARAARAEADETKAKELAGKPNLKAHPIDNDTKEALNHQIEKTIAEKKEFAEQSAKGASPALPDVSQALADPKHIYPVSKTISVISKDDKPAGTLTAGDLLKAEPGQESALKDAKETDFVTMRVMTSKGEDDEVAAGTLIKVSLKDLQDFDNEFRAKLDQGLQEANAHKDEFKQLAQK
jgi:hypothetical protein